MKINRENLQELAALHAVGALEGEEAREFYRLLGESAEARAEADTFAAVTEALATRVPSLAQPSAGLKMRILQLAERSKNRRQLEAQLRQLTPRAEAGFSYLAATTTAGWIPLPVPGAYVKLLSFDDSTGYATALGKLEAGASYPAHNHQCAEDIFMLSGDLHIGDKVIGPMDFHHAEAGTRHEVNWSERGCVLLAVLSKEDLLQQFLAA